VLEVSDLEAGYGRVEVLHSVDLRVDEGEIVALVGSNGAGKTTLLRAVSGLIAPTHGSIRFRRREIGGLPPERIVDLGIAHVPEGRRLFQGLTVRENLLAGAIRRGGKQNLERAIELFPRLGDRLGQIAGSLSGGEQQMCAIARGLMSDPELLMIDELTFGLAPNLAERILERLTAISEEGTAVLLVDQDVDLAFEAAARGYVLETGGIVASGPSEELLADPKVREAYPGVAAG
jgi:branched-chain amino acid transport system ATP-binding protein